MFLNKEQAQELKKHPAIGSIDQLVQIVSREPQLLFALIQALSEVKILGPWQGNRRFGPALAGTFGYDARVWGTTTGHTYAWTLNLGPQALYREDGFSSEELARTRADHYLKREGWILL
jgi:hypothetical protein